MSSRFELITELENETIKCTKCSISDKGVVFGSGNPESGIMLVGEAPAQQEVIDGIPFVGKAGKLLRDNLTKIKVDNSGFYITNTTLCWPREGKKTRAPNAGEASNCRRWVEKQIEVVRPEYIMTLGLPAAKWFFPDVGTMGSIAGKKRDLKFNSEEGEFTITVFFNYHPAYILRQNSKFDDFFSNLVKFFEEAKSYII